VSEFRRPVRGQTGDLEGHEGFWQDETRLAHAELRLESLLALPISLAEPSSRRQGRRFDVQLEIAGDGTERPALDQLARELGIADRVRFLGNVPYEELPARYEAAHAFLIGLLERRECDFDRLLPWLRGKLQRLQEPVEPTPTSPAAGSACP
jgi:hypothetical protein